ncbi:MAG: DNA alkylation repair protein [Candidatus Pacearchaeota archaeon]
MLKTLLTDLKNLENKEKSVQLSRYFKTGKGEYGEGDIFLGLTSQQIKDVSKKYINLNLEELNKLLTSNIHEHRATALRILTYKFNKSNEQEKENIFNFYLKNTKNINNWDLVDLSAPNIAGTFLFDKDKEVLYKLAKSKNLWEKRISIISTYAFIRNNEFKDTLAISEILLKDPHDLIHKAVGWMLREIGKKDIKAEEEFLQKHYKAMPRTMLRYAIEKFPEEKRQGYLKGNV